MTSNYDFVAIGGGTAGLMASTFAAKLGLRVALIEKNRLGGDCTWTGCVPSKALLYVAKTAHQARHAAALGVNVSPPHVDMSRVRHYLDRAINTIYAEETPEVLAAQGIDVILGPARFTGSHRIQVNGRTIGADKFLIATGSAPQLPPLQGLETVDYHTNESIFENERLPDHLLVLGAGPIGVELGQAYRRLGAEVTIVDVALLPDQDRDAAGVLASILDREGIDFVPGLCGAVAQNGSTITIHVKDRSLSGDMLLVATGRQPRVQSLDLQKAGIQFNQQGLPVNDALQTNVRHVYAAGDVLGGPNFTHLAGWQGFVAARNALLPGRTSGVGKDVPLTVFTDPEIAQVGLSEAEARDRHGDGVVISKRENAHRDRPIVDSATAGFLKIIHKKDGTILGAVVVGARAGELVNQFALAIEEKIKLRALADTIHVYPSYSIDTMTLAADYEMERLLSGITGSLIRRSTALAWI
ncbi:MAG: FAD-dependent oxidoreductase [Candidatus Promineifilaceae bacterium]|nr:FAD-dependent oxidoreductase [Candidatus Promineifilaceae bacterium]